MSRLGSNHACDTHLRNEASERKPSFRMKRRDVVVEAPLIESRQMKLYELCVCGGERKLATIRWGRRHQTHAEARESVEPESPSALTQSTRVDVSTAHLSGRLTFLMKAIARCSNRFRCRSDNERIGDELVQAVEVLANLQVGVLRKSSIRCWYVRMCFCAGSLQQLDSLQGRSKTSRQDDVA